MMGFRGIDLTVALYIVAFLALYMLLGPAREGMKGKKGMKGNKGKKKGPKQEASFPKMKKKKNDDDDDDDDDEKSKFETVQQLATAAKAFVESQAQGGLKVDITGANKKKKGRMVHVKIKGAQGIDFRGKTRVDSDAALKSARNMLVKMFASPSLAARVDLTDKGFKKGATSFDTVAALTQSTTTALASAKAQGYTVANVMANKKWDGTSHFVHMTVYGRKPGQKAATFLLRGYSRLDTDATLMATYQTIQQALLGLQEAKKFRGFLLGNRVPMASASPAATVSVVPPGTVLPTLAPTQAPVASVPPTVSMPPMRADDPMATMPPLVVMTSAAI
jgi:hypothetical protein